MSDEIEVYVAMKDDSNEDTTNSISYVKKDVKWKIDSGCSYHMTGDRSKFNTFGTYDGNSVKFGNDAPCPMKGKGSVILTDKTTCGNTYYVEGLNYNFLSVTQLNISGCKVEFNQRKALIYNEEGKINGSGDQTKDNLFYLDKVSETCLMVKYDDVWLWHKRLYHVNFDNLVNISKMKKVR